MIKMVPYKEYLKITDYEKEEIFYQLYEYFNAQSIEFDLPQRMIFDSVKRQTLEDQNYEFATVLRDFDHFFGDEF